MSTLIFTTDYYHDYFTWLSVSDGIDSNKKKELDRLQGQIIKNKDPAFACFFAIDFGYKTSLMQNIILETKSDKYALLFAREIAAADIKVLQEIVIKSNNIKYICSFGCSVKGADHKRIENIIIKSGSPMYAHMYMKNTKSANTAKLKKIIMASNKPRYLYELAKISKSKNEILKLEDLILGAKCFTYIRLFADKVKYANVERIEQFVLDNFSPDQIRQFARYVKGSKMKKFLLVD